MKHEEDEIPAEVDFSQGVRGKYAGRLRQDAAYVLLEEDVRNVFQTSEQVNAALRMLMRTALTATSDNWRKAS